MPEGFSLQELVGGEQEQEGFSLQELVGDTQDRPTQPSPPQLTIPEGTVANRMNNPGNLRYAGQEGAVEGEQGFAQFQTPQEGLQALQRQIDLDAKRGHTLQSFITKYAPPTENDTATYISNVQRDIGVSPNTPIADIPRDAITKAIVRQESGTELPTTPPQAQEPQQANAGFTIDELIGPEYGTIGEPWKRGVQQFLSAGLADPVNAIKFYAEEIGQLANIPEMGISEVAGSISKSIYESAAKINANPSTGKYARPPKNILEAIDPKRIYKEIAEGLPLFGALIGTTMANPVVGTIAMAGIEGGSTVRSMELYEQETGESIDTAYKLAVPVIVGSFNAALERVGIDNVLGAAKNAPGLKRKLFNILTTGLVVEGPTEAAQEVTQALAEAGYKGKIPEDTGQRVVESFYAGAVLGIAGASGANVLASMARPAPQDAQFSGVVEETQAGQPLEPIFTITNPEHEMYGQEVTLSELEETGLEVPAYRRDLTKAQMLQSVPDMNESQAEGSMVVLDRIAKNKGMTTDEFIDKHIAAIVKGHPLSKGDLRQAMSDIIQEFHFSENKIKRVNQPSQDPLASAIRNTDTGEVIFGYRGQFHQELWGKSGWEYGKTQFGFANQEGNFVDRNTALRELSNKYPQYKEFFANNTFGLTSEMLIRADEQFDEEVYFQYDTDLRDEYVKDIPDSPDKLDIDKDYGTVRYNGVTNDLEGNPMLYYFTVKKGSGTTFGIKPETIQDKGLQEAVNDSLDRLKETFFQAAKGAINFAEDGKVTIKAFKSADVSTMIHELGHLFRRTLDGEDLVRAEEWVGVEDGSWTRENEEYFARTFEGWIAEGRPRNHKLSAVFARLHTWLMDIYSGIVGSEIDIEITPEIRQFFNDTLADIETEADADNVSGFRKTARIWKDNLFDAFDIERKFQRVGMGETGFWIKNNYSQEEMYAQEALDLLSSMRKLVGRKRLTDVFLKAESIEAMENIQDQDMREAVQLLRDYFDQSEQEYKTLGGFKKGFKQRYIDELEAEMKKADKKGDKKLLRRIEKEYEEAQDLEFVHIPYTYWFLDAAADPTGGRKTLSVIESKYKRDNPTIANLIKDGAINKEDIKAEEILLSYSRRKGRDLALLKIIRAAEEEGAAVKDDEADSPFLKRVPGYLAPALSEYRVNNTLYEWVVEATRSSHKLSLLRKFLNIGKMGAFWNPLFLGMYDTIQATMAGALSPLRPISSMRYVREAIQDFRQRTEEWREAREFGIESKPYASPLQSDVNRFRAAASGRVISELQGIWKGANLNTLAGAPIRMSKSIYQASWDIAWGLDSIVRQVTYRYYIDQGLSPREAAQKAALAHADYASVPPETRRKLNTIFFTPTFKVAMGKFFYNTIKDIGDTFAGRADMQKKDRAAVLMRTVAIMTATDMMMLSLGFDRDEWGRRYKRPVDTDAGNKELVVTWSGPHNLFLKYYNRILQSMGPEVENGLLSFWNNTKWEIHPLYRVTSEIVANKGVNGKKIVSTFDDADLKAMKRTKYFVANILQMYRQILGEEGLGEKGRELFAKEYGDTLAIATGFFTFNYARTPENIATANNVNRLLGILEEDIGATNVVNRILRGEDWEDIQKDIDQAEPRIDNAIKRLDEMIREKEEAYYSYPLAPATSDVQEEPEGLSIEELLNQ